MSSKNIIIIWAVLFFTSSICTRGDDGGLTRNLFNTPSMVKSIAPGGVFTEGESLLFLLDKKLPAGLAYKVTDWTNTIVQEGKLDDIGSGELKLSALPRGYYWITMEKKGVIFSGTRSFAVVANISQIKHNVEMPFALDTAQSWLAPGNYPAISDIVARSGVNMVRERMSWRGVDGTNGKFQWGSYLLNANLLQERGVRVCGMFHDAPQWTQKNSKCLPDNLMALYNFTRQQAQTFKGKMYAWEFWNEQDLPFTVESAWDYASCLKAAYLGYKDGDPDIPVAVGGFVVDFAGYAHLIMRNGAPAYIDIFNYHIYEEFCLYPEKINGIKSFMKKYGMDTRPLWITENGMRSEGSGVGKSIVAGFGAHSAEQELIIAEGIPKMMIYLQSLGVDKNFFFVLPPYNEQGGNKDWGLMRRDFTVKPGYFALSHLISEIGNADLLGRVELAPGVRGFLYRQPDGTQTLVYWSLSELDTEMNRPNLKITNYFEKKFDIKLKSGKYSGHDFLGRKFDVEAYNGILKLTSNRYPHFLSRLQGLVACEKFEKKMKTGMPNGTLDKTIVFKLELSDDFQLNSAGKDSVEVKCDNAKFVLQVYNFSEKNKTGTIKISGGKVLGLPIRIDVPAMGKIDLPLMFTPVLPAGKAKTELMVTGSFDEKTVSPLIAPVICQKLCKNFRRMKLKEMNDPANWKQNTSGKMKISYDVKENSPKFSSQFDNVSDRWAYPIYELQLPQESLVGAWGISLEVKVNSSAAVMQMLLMANTKEKNGKEGRVFVGIPAPKEQWETKIIQFPDILTLNQVVKLQIGLNVQKENKIDYWVRNVEVLFPQH